MLKIFINALVALDETNKSDLISRTDVEALTSSVLEKVDAYLTLEGSEITRTEDIADADLMVALLLPSPHRPLDTMLMSEIRRKSSSKNAGIYTGSDAKLAKAFGLPSEPIFLDVSFFLESAATQEEAANVMALGLFQVIRERYL